MKQQLLKCCAPLALVLFCSCPETDHPTPTPALFDAYGLLVGPDAPDRLTCSTDAECVIESLPSNRRGPIPPPQLLGCCQTNGLDAMSKAFFDWMRAFQTRHCPQDLSACPPQPPPAPPSPCMLEARCREGRCSNACSAP